ncbi:Chemotaxis protein CheY [uncultured archaeon]|nr:Chemotaxis protein CheY [uncultured archaeon]
MKKQKLLIVDDEPLNVELIEKNLSKDYEVIKASTGIEALTKVVRTRPDIVLLDIMMPNMNGYAVCKEIKNNWKDMPIPILVISPLKEREDKMKAIEAGADDFIIDPVDMRELDARVKSLLMLKHHEKPDITPVLNSTNPSSNIAFLAPLTIDCT